MRRQTSTIIVCLLVAVASPLAAQLALPRLPTVPDVAGTVGGMVDRTGELVRGTTQRAAEILRQARLDRIESLVRGNRAVIERDIDGEPVRRGTLLVLDPGQTEIEQLKSMGFAVTGEDRLDDLGMSVVELAVPPGSSLASAQRRLAKDLPSLTVASDPLHFQSGMAAAAPSRPGAIASAAIAPPVGLIDGAPAQPVAALKGFAIGAPTPSNHGSAVVSLAARAGVRTMYVADVYGTDPAGGNALAIVRGMNWLVGQGVKVISISLVGPRNPILERAVKSAEQRQVAIVAAVGNDGPAAPPSFPASYPGVIAVTAVDKRDRPLIEAGRALHLDYAAPGADVTAEDAEGRWIGVRGTSFAAPLVAARAGAAIQRGVRYSQLAAALDGEARPLARKLPDARTGRGLLCERCR